MTFPQANENYSLFISSLFTIFWWEVSPTQKFSRNNISHIFAYFHLIFAFCQMKKSVFVSTRVGMKFRDKNFVKFRTKNYFCFAKFLFYFLKFQQNFATDFCEILQNRFENSAKFL
jgi:hypothetical protein